MVKRKELRNTVQKTRDLMSRYELLHPRDNINRLYAMRRKEVKDSLESTQQSKQRIIMAKAILAKESTC